MTYTNWSGSQCCGSGVPIGITVLRVRHTDRDHSAAGQASQSGSQCCGSGVPIGITVLWVRRPDRDHSAASQASRSGSQCCRSGVPIGITVLRVRRPDRNHSAQWSPFYTASLQDHLCNFSPNPVFHGCQMKQRKVSDDRIIECSNRVRWNLLRHSSM